MSPLDLHFACGEAESHDQNAVKKISEAYKRLQQEAGLPESGLGGTFLVVQFPANTPFD